ncbi:MAG: XRE family transcriptional regulator [Nitrospira sp.]|nr:XRE family transcriptional regulator [Nitrospira sp.]
MIDSERVVESSGNVFVDLGFPENEAQEAALKVDLVAAIRQAMQRNRLSQAKAAALAGMKASNFSALLGGKLTRVSVERLFRILRDLGADVEVTVRPVGRSGSKGHIKMTVA